MSAKRHVGVSNGNAISHVALLFAMERYGWPYVATWEEVGPAVAAALHGKERGCSPGALFPFPASAPPPRLPLQDATPDFHWPMYYECLALVRGESLPAISCAPIQQSPHCTAGSLLCSGAGPHGVYGSGADQYRQRQFASRLSGHGVVSRRNSRSNG